MERMCHQKRHAKIDPKQPRFAALRAGVYRFNTQLDLWVNEKTAPKLT